MKLIRIEGASAYYIGKLKNNILVVVDNINPLEYPYEFGEVLHKLAQDISKNEIPVYIDFSKWKRYPKIIEITYLKDIDNIDVYSSKEIDVNQIPKEVKEALSEFSQKEVVKIY